MDACCSDDNQGQAAQEAAAPTPAAAPAGPRRWREVGARGALVALLLAGIALWLGMVL